VHSGLADYPTDPLIHTVQGRKHLRKRLSREYAPGLLGLPSEPLAPLLKPLPRHSDPGH
jgi:hypothetical protein